MTASGAVSPDPTATATLADAALPPRVRRILQVLLDQVAPVLATRVQAAADALEQELFDQAERARSNELQATQLANLQQLRRGRPRLLPRMMQVLEDELARVRAPRRTPAEKPAEIPSMLTLVANDDIDQDIVLQEVARRHEGRHHETLYLLSQRFGVLAGSPALDEAELPLGPQSLCRALRAGAATLDVDLPTQLQLYRLFEQYGMTGYGEWLEDMNAALGQQGVLPGLVFAPHRARTPQAPRPPMARETPARSPKVAAPPAPAKAPTAAAPSAPMPPRPVTPPAPAQMAARPPGPPVRPSKDGASSFSALQRLLAVGHARARVNPRAAQDAGITGLTPRAVPDGASAGSGAPEAATAGLPTEQLLGTLQTLQLQVAQGQAPQAATSLGEIRERTLSGLRRAHGPQAQLAPRDEDTFELLDLLYHEIGREVRKGPATDLLGQLQVPVVQAALADREFFQRPTHPARALLNAVAEAGANWLGEEDVDPVLMQKLKGAVTQVLSTYQGDEAVFEQAHQDVQEHFQAATRKAEIAERRHVEAARGRDRLDMAKRGAADAIHAALDGHTPAPFVQALLSQAWADVLTLTRLRNGEDSAEWNEVAAITGRIADAVAGETPTPAPDLAPSIERSLVQVGYHADEAAVISRRLSGLDNAPAAGTDLAARIQARARIAAQEHPAKPALPPRTPEEDACHETLRTLPYGAWFEFVHNQQGDARRLRLSWYNPNSDHALFVNARGQKVGDHTLDGVARLMARGQARVLDESRGSLIDRAWQSAMGKLRTLAGAAA